MKYIPQKEFDELYEKCNQNRRWENPNIDPKLRGVTVCGQSGENTLFKDEYERLKHEYFNPRKLRYIIFNGEYIYPIATANGSRRMKGERI